MITNSLDKLKDYQQEVPSLRDILDYLNINDIFSFKIGKYPITGESAFLLIQEYQTKSELEKEWESHRKYIDIQIVLNGQEYMGYSPISSLKVKESYNIEKDVILYKNDDKDHSRVFIQEKHFCIFFPNDAHKPGYHLQEESHVKKAVIKVLL
jgi:biofilm protein TabA